MYTYTIRDYICVQTMHTKLQPFWKRFSAMRKRRLRFVDYILLLFAFYVCTVARIWFISYHDELQDPIGTQGCYELFHICLIFWPREREEKFYPQFLIIKMIITFWYHYFFNKLPNISKNRSSRYKNILSLYVFCVSIFELQIHSF